MCLILEDFSELRQYFGKLYNEHNYLFYPIIAITIFIASFLLPSLRENTTILAYLLIFSTGIWFLRNYEDFVSMEKDFSTRFLPDNKDALVVFVIITMIVIVISTQVIQSFLVPYPPKNDIKFNVTNQTSENLLLQGRCNFEDTRTNFVGFKCTNELNKLDENLTIIFQWNKQADDRLIKKSTKTIDTSSDNFRLINPAIGGVYDIESRISTNDNISSNLQLQENWRGLDMSYVISLDQWVQTQYTRTNLVFNVTVLLAFALSGIRFMESLNEYGGSDSKGRKHRQAGYFWFQNIVLPSVLAISLLPVLLILIF